MKKRKSQRFRIITNEQTPKTNPIDDVEKWIAENELFTKSFLFYVLTLKNAVGLASNQVAHHDRRITDRFFAIRGNGQSGDWKLIINPTIKSINGHPVQAHEGCLTWPGKTIVADRFPGIIVSYWEEDGSFVENQFLEGYEAQIWQHEINHLDGKQEVILQGQKERREEVPGRNDPCLCGSGKKFKKCCGK